MVLKYKMISYLKWNETKKHIIEIKQISFQILKLQVDEVDAK